MADASKGTERFKPRGAGEAVDELITNTASSLFQIVTATALSILSLIVIVVAASIGFEQTSQGILGGTDTSTNGFAVFLAIVSAILGFAALIQYVNGLMGLSNGLRNAKASAERRRQYWHSNFDTQ